MILSSLPSALQTSSTYTAPSMSITDVSSSKLVSALLCPRIAKQNSGCSALKHSAVRQHSSRVPDMRLLKSLASGDVDMDSASAEGTTVKSNTRSVLTVGSPIVVLEAPPMLKTAEPMPMMRANTGLIKAGDAGRIIDRRPKDVWAIRFAVGAYLIDGKYFKPLTEE